jgi:hypothetical protein
MLNEYQTNPVLTEAIARQGGAEYAANDLLDELLFLVTKFRHNNRHLSPDVLDLSVDIATARMKTITQSKPTEQMALPL